MVPLVLIESPYRQGDRNRNLRYLAWCEFHSASLGEVPIASHGNCTAYWPEDDASRLKGFEWRDRLRSVCGLVAYYIDLGQSSGMQAAYDRDCQIGVARVRRLLPIELWSQFEAHAYPSASMRRIAI